MKLHYSPTSPYARKTYAAAIAAGLDGAVELVPTDPWASDGAFLALNPLSKVPALTLDDGTTLFDSPVICEYLDAQGGAGLFPAPGPTRWTALRQQALGDGIMDSAIARLLDTRRPEARQSADWQDRQKAAIARACDTLEAEVDALGDAVTIGTLAVGCALGYLDLRFSGDAWREGRPRLAAWFAAFSEQPEMARTAPPKA